MKVVNGVQIVTLEITPQVWNTIQAGLNELPFKISAPVLQDLTTQVVRQTSPPPAPESPPAPELSVA